MPSDDTRRRYRDFFRHRERVQGALTEEERVYFALVEVGPASPLDQVAAEAGLAARRTMDSARKRARELDKRLVARGLVVHRLVRLPFSCCTHVSTPGTKGRLECQGLRKEAGVTTGCVAHHGHVVRELVPLTPRERARRLDLPLEDVLRMVTARDDAERARRRDEGKPANDAEARRWRGDSAKRGPRGTNHTSSRRMQSVPPIPPEGLDGISTSASQEGPGGHAVAPAAPGLSLAEPTHPMTTAQPESTEGGRARAVPPRSTVVDISRARETRAKVEWFRSEWQARKLPALNVLELRTVLWCRAGCMSRDELALALESATRLAARSGVRVFARVFADRGVLAELVHEERRRREGGRPAPLRPRTEPTRMLEGPVTEVTKGRSVPSVTAPPATSFVSAAGKVWTRDEVERRRAELLAALKGDS